MARGEESLLLELARRRAAASQTQALVPAPPGPTAQWPFVLGAGVVAVGAAFALARLLARRRG
jgi:hypothetical protein